VFLLRRLLVWLLLRRRGLLRRLGWRTAACLALAALCVLAAGGPAAAQGDGLWTHYSAESYAGGPPSSDVRSVLPLTGSVWVATAAGAGTYDGRCWRDAEGKVRGLLLGCLSAPGEGHDPPDTLRQLVNLVAEGPGGRLWFGTLHGVVVRQPDGEWILFEPDSKVASADVRDILVDREGATWFATHLGVFRSEAGSVETFPEPSLLAARVLFQDGGGDLWAGTQAFGLQRFDGESWHCYSATDGLPVGVADCTAVLPGDSNQVNALADDGQGGMWVGTDSGLAHFAGPETVPVAPELAAETAQSIGALWHDPDGQLWIGTESGILVSDGHTVQRPVASPFGLGRVRDIQGDLEGNVWVATDDGLWHYRRAWEPLTLADGAIPSGRGAVAQDKAGNLWFAADGSVLRRSAGRDLERLEPLAHQSAASPGGVVHAILPRLGGALWFGTSAGLVELGADGGWTEIALPLDEPYEVTSLVDARGNAVWLGSSRGLLRLAPDGAWTVERTDLRDPAAIVTLLATRDGGIWAGTSHGLLEVPLGGESRLWDTTDSLRDLFVSSLYQDTSDALWAGTYSSAGRWLGDEGDLFEPLDALSGRRVRAITEDSLDRLWFGTERGIVVRGTRATLTLTPGDGLASYDVRGLFTDRDGTVWIATANGIQHYQPGEAPPWAGFHLWAGNDLVSPQDGVLHVAWEPAKDVRVEFDGGDLSTAFGELIFCTQMVGYDPTKRCGTDPAIAYHLDTGRSYTFEMTAVDKDGHESAPVSLPVQVTQTPLTRRPGFFWFLAVVSGLLLLVIAAYLGNIAGKRWNEERVQQDILLTLRQKPGVPNYAADVEIRHLGPPGWKWRWKELRRRNLAGVFEPVERLPATPLSPAEDLDTQLEWLHRRLGLREDRPWEAEHAEQPGENGLRALGTALLRSAFPQPLLDRLAEARQAGQHARIRLSFDLQLGADLARLPWEYAYDPKLGFLGQHSDTALVRYLAVGLPDQRRLHEPLRILVVIASPSNVPLPPINTYLERTRLEEALGDMIKRRRVKLEYLVGPAAASMDPTLPKGSAASEALDQALRVRLSRQKPPFDVLHFIGHAGPHNGEEQGGVARGDMVLYGENAQGEYAPLGKPQLLGLLEGLAHEDLNPLLVFLNACQTVALDGRKALTGLVPDLIAGGKLPAVIGMQYPIGDDAAKTFAGAFYSALLRHGQVDWAVSIARNALAGDRPEDLPDWGMPVLYLQARDGFIFKTY